MKSIKVLLLFCLSSSFLACSQATQDGSDGNLEEVLADMSPSSVVGGSEVLQFQPGYVYIVKGEIQSWKTIKGKLSFNKNMEVLFTYYDVRKPKLENYRYGYINENHIEFDSESERIEGTITDEIAGTWMPSYSNTPLPFSLRITGCAVSVIDKIVVPPPPMVDYITEDTSNEVIEVKSAPVSTEEEDTEAELDRIKAELEENMKKYMEEAPDKIYDKVQVMPEYPGGTIEMMRFISRNLEYPKSAQESGTQGKVVMQFVVGADGSVSNVQVIRSVDPLLDKEAVRIISAMPRWKPGTEGGKPVRVKYTVPINFRLQ